MKELFHEVVLARFALNAYVQNSNYTREGYKERYEFLEMQIETFMCNTNSSNLVRILLHQSYFTWDKYMALSLSLIHI